MIKQTYILPNPLSPETSPNGPLPMQPILSELIEVGPVTCSSKPLPFIQNGQV